MSSLYALFLAPFLAVAVAPTYAPLAPLPAANGQLQNTVTPSGYVLNLIKIGIGVASGLAVLAIAYSGIKYMMSDVVTNKSDAVQGIKNALLGLLLAISSYLILYTINPKLTDLDILKSGGLDAPPGAPQQNANLTGYQTTYYVKGYTLSYKKREYELTYERVSLPGVINKVRCDTQGACVEEGLRVPDLKGSYNCTAKTQYTNDVAYAAGACSSALLVPGRSYTEVEAFTKSFIELNGLGETCTGWKKEYFREGVDVMLINCAEGPVTGTKRTLDYPGTAAGSDACEGTASTLSQNYSVPPGERCKPIYSSGSVGKWCNDDPDCAGDAANPVCYKTTHQCIPSYE